MATLTIAELQRRSGLVPRLKDGVPITTAISARGMSQLLQDEVACLRTWVRSGAPVDDEVVAAICRTIGMSAELARFVGIKDLSGELDRRLPK